MDPSVRVYVLYAEGKKTNGTKGLAQKGVGIGLSSGRRARAGCGWPLQWSFFFFVMYV